MKKKALIFLALFLGFILAVFLGVAFGPTGFRVTRDILLYIRIPRVILGIFAGSSLGIVGAAFQGILRNPLADPYILGTSGGACVGGALAIIIGNLPIPAFAFIGAIVAILLVYRLASFKGRIPQDTLLLSGVIVGTFTFSIVMLIMSLGGKSLEDILYLLMGHLGVVFDRNRVISFGLVLFFAILSSSLIYAHAREFNILASGEEEALTLGVEVERLKKIVFILGSLIVGLTVSFCGAIGFIGLVVPHITRLIVGPDHRILIPVSALIGAILIIVADIFARSVAPFEIPVGVITALFGVPFFAYLLRKRKAS